MARVFHAENVLAPPDELLEAFGKLNDPDVHHQGTVWITTEPRLPRVPIFYDPGKMTSALLALLQHEQSGDDQTLSLDHTPDDLVEAFRGVVDMDPGPTPKRPRKGGFGIMQLDTPDPTQEQIWNWKENVAAGDRDLPRLQRRLVLGLLQRKPAAVGLHHARRATQVVWAGVRLNRSAHSGRALGGCAGLELIDMNTSEEPRRRSCPDPSARGILAAPKTNHRARVGETSCV